MRSIKQWLKREAGQSVILVALSIAMLCGVAALVVDLGMVSVSEGQLQNAADAAALAAAQDLPTAATAKSTAVKYAGYNGVAAADIVATTPYSGNANKIEVVCKKTVQYTFARIFGVQSVEVSARAVAEKTGMSGGPFAYALFYGDQTGSLYLRAYDFTTEGGVHSNSNINIEGSYMRFYGNMEAKNELYMNGWDLWITGTAQGGSLRIVGNTSSYQIGNQLSSPAAVISMPDFPTEVINEAKAAGTAYYSNKSFNDTTVNLDTSVYVEGDLSVGTSQLNGKGTMLATGNINLNGYRMTYASDSAVCLYTSGVNKAITIQGTSVVVKGIMYAPYGSVVIKGYDVTIIGSVVAKNIDMQGTKIKIVADANAAAALPSGSVVLCE